MTFECMFSFWLTAATARKIHQYMNAKDLNLTIQHVASHLQVGDRFSLSNCGIASTSIGSMCVFAKFDLLNRRS